MILLIYSTFIFIYRYIKEWAEYKKTDAYKEFRKQQMEHKDVVLPKKMKNNNALDNGLATGYFIYMRS